jgi:hypothetical protein
VDQGGDRASMCSAQFGVPPRAHARAAAPARADGAGELRDLELSAKDVATH